MQTRNRYTMLYLFMLFGMVASALGQTRTNLIDPSQYKLGFGYNDDCYNNPTYYTTASGGPYDGCINAYEQQSGDTSSGSTGLIPVTPGSSYFLTTGDQDNNNVGGPIYYGSNGVPIHSTFVPLPMAANQVFTVPTTTTEGVTPAYLRLRFRPADIASAMLLTGSASYSGAYIAYTAPVKAAPTVTFALIGDQAYNAAPFQVSATSNSTGAITYSLAYGPATVSTSGLVTLTGANGTVGVYANVAADSNYTATQSGQTFQVSGAPVPVATTIVITPIPNKLYTSPAFQPVVSSNNTSAAAQTVTGPATIAAPGIITLTGANGLVTYTWTQAADSLHLAGSASTTFAVTGAPITGPQPGYTIVSGSHTGGDFNLISNATISFTPVSNNGTPISFKVGGNGGPVMKNPITAQVVGGQFSVSVPDSTLTSPVNVGYKIEVIDNVSNDSLLGPGYGDVQPFGATWSLDSYVPNMPALALVTAGSQGIAGPAGANGANGTNGTNGTNGAAGANGQNGQMSFSVTQSLIESALPERRNLIDPTLFKAGFSYNDDCYNNPAWSTTASGGPYNGCVNGYEQVGGDASSGSTGLIPVTAGNSYFLVTGNTNNNNVQGLIYYDANAVPIHSTFVHLPIAANQVLTVPASATANSGSVASVPAFLRLILKTSDVPTAQLIAGAAAYSGPYVPFAQLPTTTANRSPWNGKKVAFLGDSYTAGYGYIWQPPFLAYHNLKAVFQDARSGRPIGDDGLAGEGLFECYGGDPINGKFDPTFAPHQGAFGTCGAASPLSVTGNTLKQNLNLNTPDLLFVALGTNTYSTNVTGSVSDAVGAQTLHGQIKLAIAGLQTAVPTARIVWVEPVAVTDTTVGRAVAVTAVVPIIEQECALYGVPVFKLYSESGINTLNATTYLSDGIHFTPAAFQTLFANLVSLRLNNVTPMQ